MNALNSTSKFFFEPINYSEKVFLKTADLNKEQPTIEESLKARLCLLAHIVSYVVALPIILLVGLVAGAFDLVTGNGISTLKEMGQKIVHLTLYGLPVSLVGMFAPLSTTRSLAESLSCFVSKPETEVEVKAEAKKAESAIDSAKSKVTAAEATLEAATTALQTATTALEAKRQNANTKAESAADDALAATQHAADEAANAAAVNVDVTAEEAAIEAALAVAAVKTEATTAIAPAPASLEDRSVEVLPAQKEAV